MDPTQLGLAIMSGAVSLPGLLGSKQGPSAGKRPNTGTTMSGTVKSFNQQKGWGFIVAPGCGGDVYFKSHDGSISEGMQVEFTATTMQDGKVQARDITPGMPDGSSLTGTVKSYNPKKGFGFLRVPGRSGDIHFKRESLPGNMQDADQLEGQNFQFTLNSQQGKMQAFDLQYGASSGYIAPAMGSAQKRGASPGVFNQPAKRQKFSPTPSFTPTNNMFGGNTMKGVVKSFHVGNGYGFINADGVDVYFKGSSLPAGQQHRNDLVGSMVAFGFNRTADGKLQATPGIQIL